MGRLAQSWKLKAVAKHLNREGTNENDARRANGTSDSPTCGT